MKISDLKAGQGKADVTGTIKDVEEPRTIEKYGRQIKLANATLVDDSGEIKLTLWNDDVDRIKTGMIVKITNGYVSEFKGEKQLTSGKFGKIEVVDGEESEEESSSKEKKESDEEAEYDY